MKRVSSSACSTESRQRRDPDSDKEAYKVAVDSLRDNKERM